ncbi:MAG TPA: penicillin acylase family protein [Nevskiaceae bacterium]|nr:penicillin acylase family protein [Nevskiaceae bacterium]
MRSCIAAWSRLRVAACAVVLAGCASAPPQDAPRYEATITRTTFGIPHVKAADFGGLGFGAAYARAQDNICLMADAYLSVTAERSKYLGADGDTLVGVRPAKNIDSDVYHAAVLDAEALRAAFARSSADYRALVDGWVAGYNHFLQDHGSRLPVACAGQPWVRPIGRDVVLKSINAFAMLASSAMFAAQIATAVPPGDVAAPVATLDAPNLDFADVPSLGSNGWAFGGDATVNGRGLVLGNPHFPWIGPNRFYETHLTIPGRFDVAGAGIMNLPFVGIGFNRDVAWTHTVDMAAHMTVYRLDLDPADPTTYRVDGRREAMTRRDITVETRDGAPIVRTIHSTRFGPVVSIPGTEYAWTRQAAYAVADANRANVRGGDTWLDLGRARNVGDIRDALGRHLGVPFLNTMAADRAGDALYADIAAVPNVSRERFASCGAVHARLPAHLQELYVLDGSRSACAWEAAPASPVPGLLPASEQAALVRRDYVQNSNDSYRWSNPAAPLRLGPIMGRDPGLGRLRTRSGIEEIRRVLQSGRFDIDVAADTMLGNKSMAAELALPALRQLCARPGGAVEACAALARWDGRAELESRGAMLFNQFWGKVEARADLWKVPFDANDPLGTPRDLSIEGPAGQALLAALQSAAEDMQKLGLAPDAALGDAQFTQRGDERIPISGLQNGGVLNYAKTMPSSGGYTVIHGTSYFQSVTFDDQGPVAKAILTYSQSTDPASPHYADQTREFSNKRVHRFPFSDAEIAADAIGEPMTLRQ